MRGISITFMTWRTDKGNSTHTSKVHWKEKRDGNHHHLTIRLYFFLFLVVFSVASSLFFPCPLQTDGSIIDTDQNRHHWWALQERGKNTATYTSSIPSTDYIIVTLSLTHSAHSPMTSFPWKKWNRAENELTGDYINSLCTAERALDLKTFKRVDM